MARFFYAIVAFMTLVRLSFAEMSGPPDSRRCEKPYTAHPSTLFPCFDPNANLFDQTYFALGYTFKMKYSTGRSATVASCFAEFAEGKWQSERSDCNHMFGSGTCEGGMWIDNGVKDYSRSTNAFVYSCYCYKKIPDCMSHWPFFSEAALADVDGDPMALKDNGGSSEKAVSYKSQNEALKKTNKALMATLQELAGN